MYCLNLFRSKTTYKTTPYPFQERESELAQIRSRFQKGNNMWKNKDEAAETNKNTDVKVGQHLALKITKLISQKNKCLPYLPFTYKLLGAPCQACRNWSSPIKVAGETNSTPEWKHTYTHEGISARYNKILSYFYSNGVAGKLFCISTCWEIALYLLYSVYSAL